MGGKVRERVAVYFWLTDLEETKKLIREKNARMFKISVDQVTAAGDAKNRFDPGKPSGWTLTNAEIDEITAFLQARRDAIGPKIELAIECHARYNTESAIQLCRAVVPFRPAWVEEPVTSDNLDALALVRRSASVPVACGENVYTRYGFREVLEKQAAGIIQPDMAKCGGLLEARKIAAMAEIYHVPIAPHGVATPLGGTAFAHVCAATPNFMVLEWGRFWNPVLNALMKNLPEYENGFVRVPEAPGIGIELNDDAVREHMVKPGKWPSG
jgi:galactonate dehydratase